MLLSVFNPGGAGRRAPAAARLVGGVHHCFVDTTEEDAVRRATSQDERAAGTEAQVVFDADHAAGQMSDGLRHLPARAPGRIQIRRRPTGAAGPVDDTFWVVAPARRPGGDGPVRGVVLAGRARRVQKQAADELRTAGVDPANLAAPDAGDRRPVGRPRLVPPARRAGRPALTDRHGGATAAASWRSSRKGLGGKVLDFRAAIATGMVVFALYFACVYLLPTLNCEERERGVLLAQALSPASPAEILAAKFLFYPALGIAPGRDARRHLQAGGALDACSSGWRWSRWRPGSSASA